MMITAPTEGVPPPTPADSRNDHPGIDAPSPLASSAPSSSVSKCTSPQTPGDIADLILDEQQVSHQTSHRAGSAIATLRYGWLGNGTTLPSILPDAGGSKFVPGLASPFFATSSSQTVMHQISCKDPAPEALRERDCLSPISSRHPPRRSKRGDPLWKHQRV
jgi:hypothetical protein